LNNAHSLAVSVEMRLGKP